ncbi:hypothetical protein A2686_05325 [Candidatus Woesebacteria bacterium RIFCSPHIGHO2_01_FULL_38_10]|nr:MAG: hypothetical protein A2686_05325 [Candidatus Woesebacteria bacterium RIFCSPHIGHO2_01_FULL_38_10]
MTYNFYFVILATMNKKDIVVGLMILVLLAGAVYLRQRGGEEELKVPQTLSTEDKIEEKFNLVIPEGVDKAELKDVSGGTSSGLATRKFEKSVFEHSILADLPDPESGKFYEGWLVKGGELISTGKLKIAKGGWMLNFSSKTNYSDYSKVVVTIEEKEDKTPEKYILEGSF